MKYSIYKFKSISGNDDKLLAVESYIDIIDVIKRADNKWGDNITNDYPTYIGEIEI